MEREIKRDEEKVIIFVPSAGRDPRLIAELLQTSGFGPQLVGTLDELCREIENGPGAVIVSEEVLSRRSTQQLAEVAAKQPAWSDLPFIVLTVPPQTMVPTSVDYRKQLGQVTLLERPLSVRTLVAAVESVLRSRRRQYQVRQLLQDRERELKHKDEFLAMLGHELRNPLAPVRNGLHILRAPKAGPADKERAQEMMERQIKHMARLVDDLLDVSRISRGKISLRKEYVNLSDVIRATANDYRSTLEAKRVALELTLIENIFVNGDSTRLSQIVSNLLHNAAKFTDAGGQVAVEIRLEGTGEAAVSVRDSGQGMTPELLTCLFEPFRQAETTIDRSPGGLGLGLVLVKRLVELHGGTVRAHSDGLDKGSHFTIHLPLAARQRITTTSIQKQSDGVAHRRVLLIEDNIDAAESMRLLLELAGHEVQLAHEGRTGLLLAAQFKPEILICDIGLPGGMDGYAVARAMCSIAGMRAVTKVALTGYGQREDHNKGQDAGFDLFLTKPVDPELLNSLVNNPQPILKKARRVTQEVVA